MRLLYDEMLKKVAKWSRMFGIDSAFATGSDDEILQNVKKSRRILITRDRQLSLRARKRKIKCVLVHSVFVPEQLAEIELALGKQIFSFPEESRCPACNSLLRIVKKEQMKDRVPESVYRQQVAFWVCKNKTCGKIYWEGGHWKNIKRIYEELANKRKNKII